LDWPGTAVLAAAGAVVVLAVLACRGDVGSAAVWDGAVRDSAGIQIVENFGAPMWREDETWELTEVLRIGAVEGAPEYEFGRISGIAVLSDRRIVVADAMAHELRFFNPEGVLERSVGRAGQGPGEFGDGLLYPKVGPGDTLLVFDRGNQQAHVIAPDGTWIESFSTLPENGHWFGMVYDAPPTGRLVSIQVPLQLPEGGLADSLDVLLERDLHGAILDTVARIPTYMTTLNPGAAGSYYGNMVDIKLCESSLVIGHNYTHRTVWYGSGGTIERIIDFPSERPPLTEEDRAVMMTRWDQLAEQYNIPPGQAEQIKSTVHFEDRYPAYARFACGPAGTLMMQRFRPLCELREEEASQIRYNLGRPPGATVWDVFDRDGRYLGAVDLPGTEWVGTVSPVLFVQDRATDTWYMYSTWSDELDVQYVVSWRLDGPMPG
jgi:hypothetical protein